MHRVAVVVQIPPPWIRSIDQDRRQPRSHFPSFLCDPRLCKRLASPLRRDHPSPFSVLCSLFSSSRLASVPLALARPHLHRSSSSSPSAIAAASSRQRADARRQHTGIYASPGSYLRVLKHPRTWPFSLSLSLLSPGEHPRTRHAGTVLHYSSVSRVSSHPAVVFVF